jgi:ABC-type multidrug transport system ATPase subunit
LSVQIKALSKRFNGKTVLKNISASFPGRVAITGPNGTGKTTLLRIITGLSRADSGEVHLPCRRNKVAFVSGETFLYPVLSVRENLKLYGGQTLDSLVQRFQLQEKLDARVETLSAGQKLRVSLVRALAVNPELLLLDEPLNTLDQEGRALLIEELSSFKGRIVLTTHDLGPFSDFTALRLEGGDLC